MPTPRTIKVFIASPGDLAVERRAFKDTIDALNKGFGRGANVVFEALAWEDAIYGYGRRPQSVINDEVDRCDLFILALWRRWGQKATDAKPAASYTEEEFNRAVARFDKTQSPSIHILFKHIPPDAMADPGQQLKKVLRFRKQIAKSKKVLGRPFNDEEDFVAEIEAHLIAYAQRKNGDDHAAPLVADVQVENAELKAQLEAAHAELSKLRAEAEAREKSAVAKKKKAKTPREKVDATSELSKAKAEAATLALAESAAKAALEGRIEEARQDFAKALDGTVNLDILYLGYDFFNRIGELDEAERLLHRWLAISGRENQTVETAAALGNLGGIAQTRGDLDAAEKLHREALEIERKLGRLEGQANQLGNLGVIAETRGDHAAAEKLLRESLEIDRKLGRLEYQANQFVNLGNVALTRGDLDAAEKLHREALEIDRKLGRLEGQASTLGNLGLIEQQRGNIPEARRLWTEARHLFAKIGIPHMVKKHQGWLDRLPPE